MSGRLLNQLNKSCQVFVPSAEVPVILGSSPITTSIAAPNRNPVMTAFDRNWEIQPILRSASSRNKIPVTKVIAATRATASSLPETPVIKTALPATAANAELGPVEIWREVPKRAYRIAPAAAAYRPYWIGTPAMPAYPSAFGTTSAVTVKPAIKSKRSQLC